MMGRAHALSGYVGGAALAEALFMAPPTTRLVAALATAGGALLPDLDQVASRASCSLGPLTKLLARGLAKVSIEVYHATRTPLDNPNKTNPHRLITHTPVGALAFGLVAALACLAHPLAAAVVTGLMVALGVSAVPQARTLAKGVAEHVGGGLVGGGLAAFLLASVGGWWVATHESAWWWVVPVAVTLGAQLHREGDWCTKQGVPRRLWPKVKDGRRWDTVRCRVHWTAGDEREQVWVTPGLGVLTVVAGAWVSGLAPWVLSLWLHRNG